MLKKKGESIPLCKGDTYAHWLTFHRHPDVGELCASVGPPVFQKSKFEFIKASEKNFALIMLCKITNLFTSAQFKHGKVLVAIFGVDRLFCHKDEA